MASYATLDEAFGSSTFMPKKKLVTAKPDDKFDKDAAGMVFNSPQRRTMAAVDKHKELIGNLEHALPIATSEEDRNSNYKPLRVSGYRSDQKINQIEHFYNPATMPATSGFAYGPPKFEGFEDKSIERKLDRILSRMNQNRAGYETPPTHDMLLYVFTGVFTLFVLDSFVSLGRKLR